MRYVERDKVPPPAWFASTEARRGRQDLIDFFEKGEAAVQQSRMATKTGTFDTSDSISDDRIEALLKLFDGRCAFCETPTGPDPIMHRFRPASNATPVSDTSTSHLYYAWLKDAWQNLYPLCRECEPQQVEHFPVSSGQRAPLPELEELRTFHDREDGRWPSFPLDENPVFVDPCYDRKLWRHFRFLPNGTVRGRDRRGRETIDHFKLDRPALVEARAEAFAEQLASLEEMFRGRDSEASQEYLGERRHTGAWHILLRELLQGALGQSRAPTDLDGALTSLRKLSDGYERMDRAIAALESETNPVTIAMGAAPPEIDISKLGARPKKTSAFPHKLTIRNFKSLEHLTLSMPPVPDAPPSTEAPAPSLLVLGENASGKSTLLEALALALMGIDRRLRLKLKAEHLVLDPQFLGSDRSPFNTAQVDLTYDDGTELSLKIVRDGQGRYSEGFHENGTSTTLPIFAYGAFRQYLKTERRNDLHRHVRSLFQADYLLSNPEKWLVRLNQSDFNMVTRALRSVFSIDGEFDVLERDDKRVFVVTHRGDGDARIVQRTPLSIVSSGFRSVLAMLCDIMQGLMNRQFNPEFQTLETARAVVLIDEIEAHLHPRWKLSIMTGLREALPHVFFIATSHDPLCLRGMAAGEVLVMEQTHGGESEAGLPVFTEALVDLPDNQGWTVQQLLTADFFQLRSTESATAEHKRARIEDILARGANTEEEREEVEEYLRQFSADLPIGDNDVHRIVQEAIQHYLAKRREATQVQLKALHGKTRQDIIDALMEFDALR
tara:strand:- start:4590 stop:6929 length:2340 start_codon:yes stop_codon:yes gene_type:complete